ncbi:ribonuclease H-like domain-containing protein [Tanacetum coccineum]
MTNLKQYVIQQRKALINKSKKYRLVNWDRIIRSQKLFMRETNELFDEEKLPFLKYDCPMKDISIKDLKNQLEEALKEKDDLKLKLEKFEESSKNLTKLINSQISAKDKAGLVNDRFKTGEGFHAVPPPYTGNYMPSRPDLSFAGLDDYVYKTKVSETITTASKTSKDSLEKPKIVRPSAPIIEDWDTDSDNDSVFRPKTDQTKPKFTKINFVKSDENVKSVNKENTHRQEEYLRKSQSPMDNRSNWNGMMTQKLGNGFEFIKKAYFVCGSFNHLIKDCDFHDKKMVEKPVLNNKGRVTGQREIRPVWNNAQRVNHQNKFTHPHSKRNFVPTAVVTKSRQVPVNTAKQSSLRAAASISTARPVNIAAPKSKHAGFRDQQEMLLTIPPKTVDHTCLKDLTMLIYKADPRSPKGGKITRKCKIRTGKLDFEDVYFVKELKFNLFSVSQMYDKKNSVLFTKTECLVLSPDFKLPDESQVLLKVPRQNNIYSFNLKEMFFNSGEGKAHSKLLVKNQVVSSIKQNPLQMLLMDLFGPTSWEFSCFQNSLNQNEVAEKKNSLKTDPFELLHGRPPSISFMRPFGCPVTILSTLDPLGKFDEKADEGFFVGYFINSKAFRVFNTRTRKVEENLHINFLENKPNVAGSGPDWLFDIDLLTNSMNYKSVTTGNQTNKNVDTYTLNRFATMMENESGTTTMNVPSAGQATVSPTEGKKKATKDA